MYSTGYSPGPRLLGGLSSKPNVAAYGKGRGMQSAAALGMKMANQNQEMALNQAKEDSGQRMQAAQNYGNRAANESQARMQAGAMNSARANFDMGMRQDYANADKKRALDFRQSLFNSLIGDL